MIAWTLFYNPMPLSADASSLWLMLPLCASAAIVYKTIRTEKLRRLPLEILAAILYMIVGLAGLAVALWLIQKILS